MPWIVVQTETRSTTNKVKGRQHFRAEVSTTNWLYHSFPSLFFWIFVTGPNYNSKVLNSWSEARCKINSFVRFNWTSKSNRMMTYLECLKGKSNEPSEDKLLPLVQLNASQESLLHYFCNQIHTCYATKPIDKMAQERIISTDQDSSRQASLIWTKNN